MRNYARVICNPFNNAFVELAMVKNMSEEDLENHQVIEANDMLGAVEQVKQYFLQNSDTEKAEFIEQSFSSLHLIRVRLQEIGLDELFILREFH